MGGSSERLLRYRDAALSKEKANMGAHVCMCKFSIYNSDFKNLEKYNQPGMVVHACLCLPITGVPTFRVLRLGTLAHALVQHHHPLNHPLNQ